MHASRCRRDWGRGSWARRLYCFPKAAVRNYNNQTTAMDCLEVPDAGNSPVGHWQASLLLRAVRECPLHACLLPAGQLWHPGAWSLLSSCSRDVLPKSTFPLLSAHQPYWFRVCCLPVWLRLNELHLQWPSFPKWSHSVVLGVRDSTSEFGGERDTM